MPRAILSYAASSKKRIERSAIQPDPSSRCNSEADDVDGVDEVDRDIIRGDTSHVFEDRLQRQ